MSTSSYYQKNLAPVPMFEYQKPSVNALVTADVTKYDVVKPGKDMTKLLYDLLSNATPHGTEQVIRDIIIDYFGNNKDVKPFVDAKGNLHIQVGDKPSTMFSSHMDIVGQHKEARVNTLHISGDKDEVGAGYVYASRPTQESYYADSSGNQVSESVMKQDARSNGFQYQNYTLFPNHGIKNKRQLFGSDSAFDGWVPTNLTYTLETHTVNKPCILGADDKLGCYIMCRLIEAGVEGYYVFHVGEECGGIGSNYTSEHRADTFRGMNHCIAFDRARYSSIITHQSGGRCCSDEFADALAEQMNPHLPPQQQMESDPTGSFTDSANYTNLIPECTNLSVGYRDQHTDREHFDLLWLEQHLIPALLKVDWSSLPAVRRIGKPDVPRFHRSRGYSHGYGQRQLGYQSPKQTSVVSTRRSLKEEARKSQSALDKFDNCLDKIEKFDPDDGFFYGESNRQKVQRVVATFIRDKYSIEDMAQLVVTVAENAENDWKYDNFNF